MKKLKLISKVIQNHNGVAFKNMKFNLKQYSGTANRLICFIVTFLEDYK